MWKYSALLDALDLCDAMYTILYMTVKKKTKIVLGSVTCTFILFGEIQSIETTKKIVRGNSERRLKGLRQLIDGRFLKSIYFVNGSRFAIREDFIVSMLKPRAKV